MHTHVTTLENFPSRFFAEHFGKSWTPFCFSTTRSQLPPVTYSGQFFKSCIQISRNRSLQLLRVRFSATAPHVLCSSLQRQVDVRLQLCGLRHVVVHVQLGVAAAHPALAAHNTRRSQQQQRWRDQQQYSEACEYANDLCPMPNNRRPGMAQFIFARSLVVVAQQKIVLRNEN